MSRKSTLTVEEKNARKTQYMREYYQRRKPEFAELRAQKINCEICYGRFTVSHKAQHLKSARHTHAVQVRSQTQAPEKVSDLKK